MTDRRPDDAWSGLGTGWAIVSTLIAGMLTLGLVGWLIDMLVGTSHVFLAVGGPEMGGESQADQGDQREGGESRAKGDAAKKGHQSGWSATT